MDKNIHIGLVEDQQLFREGLKSIIESHDNFEVVFESDNGYSVIEKLQKATTLPNVMLIDLHLPPNGTTPFNGLDLTRQLKEDYPEIKVLILSINDDPFYITQLIQNGANGYMNKNSASEEIFEAIESMLHKGTYINKYTLDAIQSSLKTGKKTPELNEALTKREIEVLRLICQQMTSEEIGDRLFISPLTVNGHRNNLLQKTHSKNVTGLVMYAIKNKVVDIND